MSILISKALRMARVNEGSHSFTCHPHAYPRMEWAILPLIPSHSASPQFGWYSFLSHKVGGWVGLGGLLHTEVVCPPEDGHPSQYQPTGDRTHDHWVASPTPYQATETACWLIDVTVAFDIAGREKLGDYLEVDAEEARNVTHSFLGPFVFTVYLILIYWHSNDIPTSGFCGQFYVNLGYPVPFDFLHPFVPR